MSHESKPLLSGTLSIHPDLEMQSTLQYLDVILSDVTSLHDPPGLYSDLHGLHG